MITKPTVTQYAGPTVLTVRNQSCPNPLCMDYGKQSRKVGIHSQKDLRLICLTCGKTWVSHLNTFYYNMKTHPSKIQEAYNLSLKGYSVRKIAGSVAVTPSTIQRWKNLFRTLNASPMAYKNFAQLTNAHE